MSKFTQLFNKVGGWNILGQYARGHVLLFAMTQTLLQGFSKKSLEIMRMSVENRVQKKLRKKYRSFITQFKDQYVPQPMVHSNKVWVCWFQGMEQAPPVVQRCFRSLQQLPDREIIVLTEENYTDYVTFPPFILEKVRKGIIGPAHFSDLLRLELLIRHGGTWIDATVFCSGGEIPSYMLDSELFLFQTLKPGLDGHATCISNWFMTAHTNHPLLQLTLALLYRYWEQYNGLVDYFIFHQFFQLATEAYPQAWEQVIPFSSALPHILLLRLFAPYEEESWQAIRDMTPFHKLTYKFTPEDAALPDTYFAKLICS